MASRKLEATLALLNQARHQPTSEAAIAILRQVLKSKYGIAVAQAAKLIGELELQQLTPDLAAAFGRFMLNGSVTDVGCIAKFRIAEALYRMEYSEETLFLQGIVWGGKEDTAARLRGICALALVRMNYPNVLNELADLLADPKPEARMVAAQAIAYSDNPQGVPLLRLKVQLGDPAPQVLAECFTALLKLAPIQSLSLVASFLYAPEEQVCEMAALALGESRLLEAFDILRSWWQRHNSPLRATGLLAIAMLRHDQPLEFLLSLVAEATSRDAKDAISALSIYRQDERLWQRVREIIDSRGDIELIKAINLMQQ